MTHTPGSPATAPSSASVLVIGESLIDIVVSQAGTTDYPGGSPMNVAFGLARLDVPTTLLTYLGNDANAAAIEAHLASAGVTVAPSSHMAKRTGTAKATVDDHGVATYDFDLAWEFADPSAIPVPTLVHVGSIAAFLRPGASGVEHYLRGLDSNILVSYDPNIRPALVGDHESAVAQFENFAALADVLKLSDEDAEWLFPGLDQETLISEVLARGPRLVAITGGGVGTRLASSQARVTVAASKVVVADTIGAGDSFMSALIASVLDTSLDALSEGTLRAIGEFASRAAAITVSRHGAQPPTRADLSAALPTTT